jgi:hypothetical protein
MTTIEPAAPGVPVGRSSAGAWAVLTRILTFGVFVQAFSAGSLLDGDGWARDVHRSVGAGLVIAALVGGLLALVLMRDAPGGRRFGAMLVVAGVVLIAQYALGTAAADGNDTLWIHVPLGVALVGVTMRLNVLTRTSGHR